MFTSLLYLLLGILSSYLGTIPMGPINMTVVYTAVNQHLRAAIRVSLGAAMVEVLQVFVAIYFGQAIVMHLEDNVYVRWASILVFLLVGAFFLTRKERKPEPAEVPSHRPMPKVLKGMLVGLLNPQALPFWFFVVTLLQANELLAKDLLSDRTGLLAFLAGVSLGKFSCLATYAFLSDLVARRTKRVSLWVNRIIGTVFLVLALIQLLK